LKYEIKFDVYYKLHKKWKPMNLKIKTFEGFNGFFRTNFTSTDCGADGIAAQ